jgi:xyloglucan galactosyltransferase MUR3
MLKKGLVAPRRTHHRVLRQTDQFALEIIMHRKARSSPFRTLNPDEANVFYVPYYSYAVKACNEPQSAKALKSTEAELFRILAQDYPYWNRSQGSDHVTSIAYIEREHTIPCDWCSTFMNHREVSAMKVFAIERSAAKSNPASNVIVVPYPSTVHFTGSAPEDMDDFRPILVSCMATGQHLLLRLRLKAQLDDAGSEGLWIDPMYEAGNQDMPASSIAAFERSVFCLQPYGDSPTRKSFYDALLSGTLFISSY